MTLSGSQINALASYQGPRLPRLPGTKLNQCSYPRRSVNALLHHFCEGKKLFWHFLNANYFVPIIAPLRYSATDSRLVSEISVETPSGKTLVQNLGLFLTFEEEFVRTHSGRLLGLITFSVRFITAVVAISDWFFHIWSMFLIHIYGCHSCLRTKEGSESVQVLLCECVGEDVMTIFKFG